MKVLCYGATGVQGAPVPVQLLRRNHYVRVILRDPNRVNEFRNQGFDVVTGDLLDSDSLKAASTGMDAIFLMLPLVYDEELIMPYFQNVLYAAQKANIKLLVFNSSTRVPAMPTDVWAFELKRKMEARLSQSGVPFIVLRPTFYMENLLGPWTMVPLSQRQAVTYVHAVDRKVSWICAWDMASFCVSALERPELAGSFIDVGGPEQLDGNELAGRLSEITGTILHYEQADIDNFVDYLEKFAGARAAREIRALNLWWLANKDYDPGFIIDADKVLKLLPVSKLTTFTEWASNHAWKL